MSLPATVTSASSVIVSRSAERVRGVGNANSSRTLDGECAGDDRFAGTAQRGHRAAHLSQSGTGSAAPLWNGPRLRPAFVAQVLGQVMMDARDQALSLAPAAYGRQPAQIAPGAFFNDDI
jgi:hypothetical protein